MGATGLVQVPGPLAAYAAGFEGDLGRLGYSRWTVIAELYLMGHVSSWLADRGLGAAELTAVRIEEYLRYRRASGHVRRLTPRGLAPLLAYLGGVGVVPMPAPRVAVTAQDRLLGEFERYLVGERGLAASTVGEYCRVAAALLAACCQPTAIDELGVGALMASDINAFVLEQSVGRGAGSLANVVTGLRALLRFLYLRGYTERPLAATVPGPAWRRGGGPSRALAAGDVLRLLAGCDRQTAAGRRDYAILVTLARLGLRAGELAALTLGDVDWRAGEIVVLGKGARCERLPLPVDVGEALAGYCRSGRRSGDCGRLFLHVRAPYCGLTVSAVSGVVARACQRAGLDPVGAHRLRHTAATEMRRAGAPLTEIGQVLRHRRAATTALYATTDPDALVELARPWPGSPS